LVKVTKEELFKVHKLFNTLRTELEEHLVKEELLLPIIKEYEVEKNKHNKEEMLNLLNELEKERTVACYFQYEYNVRS